MNFKACAAVIAFIGVVFLGQPAVAQEGLSAATKDFVYKVFIDNEFVIESSQVAVTQATTPVVSSFARTMIADESKINAGLEQAIAASNLGLMPSRSLDKQHQMILDSLGSAPASMFDRLYIQEQADAQNNTASLLRDYILNGDNDNLKQFATSTLPKLYLHQEMIQSLERTSISAK